VCNKPICRRCSGEQNLWLCPSHDKQVERFIDRLKAGQSGPQRLWSWLKPRLRQFCNTWEEWHAGVNGALWPTTFWLMWAIRGQAPEGQLQESMHDDAAYVAGGISLRLLLIGGLLLWLDK